MLVQGEGGTLLQWSQNFAEIPRYSHGQVKYILEDRVITKPYSHARTSEHTWHIMNMCLSIWTECLCIKCYEGIKPRESCGSDSMRKIKLNHLDPSSPKTLASAAQASFTLPHLALQLLTAYYIVSGLLWGHKKNEWSQGNLCASSMVA